jgi:outer membrane lipoprotein carrier protein
MRPKIISLLMFLPVLVLTAQPARAVGLRDVIEALESPFQSQQIKDYSADFFQESRIASLDRLQRARGEVSVRFSYRRNQVPLVMFHWEYQEPTRQEIVSDGKTLWVYLPENNQVIQSDIEMVSQARESDPMTFLTGLGNLSRDFLISYAEPNRDVKGNYVLNLRPRRTTALINRMVIVVDRDAVETPSARSGRDAAEAPAAADRAVTESRRPGSRLTPTPAAPTPEEFFGKDAGGSRQSSRSGGLVFPILATTVFDPNGNSTTIEFNDVKVNRGIPAGQFQFILPPGVEVVRPTGKEMGF